MKKLVSTVWPFLLLVMYRGDSNNEFMDKRYDIAEFLHKIFKLVYENKVWYNYIGYIYC